MTATEERKMLRDIHTIAMALERIAKSCTATEMEKSLSDPEKKALEHYDEQMLGSDT